MVSLILHPLAFVLAFDFGAADLGVLLVAGYVAVMVLVRLMTAHRDQVIRKFQDAVRREKEAQSQDRSTAANASYRQAG